MRKKHFTWLPTNALWQRIVRSVVCSLCLPCAIFLSLAEQVNAADGAIDASFGTSGKVTTAVGSVYDSAYAIALQDDGKIVVAGNSQAGPIDYYALARYNANGTLDTSFNATGKVTTSIGGSADYAKAIAIQSDGKIVAAGSSIIGSSYDFSLARYNSNGSLDTTFGSGGKVITDFQGSEDKLTSIAIQDDGKIIAAGYVSTGGRHVASLARYTTSGVLDPTFGIIGIVTTPIGSTTNEANAVLIQDDGKIVMAGSATTGSNIDFALTRYNADGTLDSTFGSGGNVTTDIAASNDYINAIKIQPDGKIVAFGYLRSGSNNNYALARYNANGTLDPTFNGTGTVTADINGGTDFGYAVDVLQNGQIVVAGSSTGATGTFDFTIIRYNANGSVDSTFGTAGQVFTDFNASQDFATAMAIQPDGKIILAGGSEVGSIRKFALARYANSSPAVDPVLLPATVPGGFGGGGCIYNPLENPSLELAALLLTGTVFVAVRKFLK